MTPKDRINLINGIALHLQKEYNTSYINMLLEGYGVKTENVHVVSNKREYIINLLKGKPNKIITDMATDLNIEFEHLTLNEMTKQNDKIKIFISHSSKNSKYGNALVQLLTGIGVSHDQIIFTSNSAYGTPMNENIFDWLKNRINEKPLVLYLLSPEYYSSIACLNEMGAAWVVENDHVLIFTPNFKLDSYEFQNGVLNPKKMGFYINDQDGLTKFIEYLKESFSIEKNQIIINQQCAGFIEKINSIEDSFKNLEDDKLQDESISLPEDLENFLQSEYEIKFTYYIHYSLDNQIIDHYYFTLNVTWDEIWAAILPTMNVGEADLNKIESSLTIFLIKCADELFREKKIDLKFDFRTNNSINLRNHLINKVLSHFIDSELIKEKNIKDSRTHWTLGKYGEKLMKQSRSTNKRKPKGKIVRGPHPFE